MADEISNVFSHVKLNEDNIENDMMDVESNENNIENEIMELNEMVETKRNMATFQGMKYVKMYHVEKDFTKVENVYSTNSTMGFGVLETHEIFNFNSCYSPKTQSRTHKNRRSSLADLHRHQGRFTHLSNMYQQRDLLCRDPEAPTKSEETLISSNPKRKLLHPFLYSLNL
ncbi:hypothetical protein CFP56_025641 [Quercus suber]|uniref:Uncharacterized protein n=1 Tax=Quercus suber TaxID=58331 RepID=A0AAW0K3G1_QUESU